MLESIFKNKSQNDEYKDDNIEGEENKILDFSSLFLEVIKKNEENVQ